MSRWKAAGIHLSISALIGLGVLNLVFVVWYPEPYFAASGGQHLVLLLLGIDLVLGPTLTLVVVNRRKAKHLITLDLAVIGIVQCAALLYGLHVITQSRPVFIVGAVDRFNSVAAIDIDDKDLAAATRPEYGTRSWTGPRVVAARLPTDPEESNALLSMALAGRKDIQHLPRYYVPYAEEAKNLLARAKPLDALRSPGGESARVLDAWLADTQRPADSIAWLPLVARKSVMTILLDARTGEPLGAVPIDPWDAMDEAKKTKR